ncbi:MAG: Parallel beta-helix repeat [Verrucomicrobiales bacterium]|nr:Parallel beta-helix repeat [Verrucomicrobiales bacterium]
MKKNYLFAVAILISTLCSTSVRGQGSLTPPGGPAPTMKTLSQIEPRTPISALPYSITTPGSYYFTTNLSGSNGITIVTNNVTLDLSGFTLQGVSSTVSGINISGAYNHITVRNGCISGWSLRGIDGFYNGGTRNTLYENLIVSSNGYGGIVSDKNSIIRNCCAYGNGFGNTFVGLSTESGQIVDCVARGNASAGIFGYNTTIRNCVSESNVGPGFECNAGSVWDCGSYNNSSYGIELEGGPKHDVVTCKGM